MFAFGLRVYLLGNQELRGDEAFSYTYTQLQPAEVIPELIAQGDPHSPLHYLALNGWTRLAGDSELALRYLSAAAGVLLVAVLFALGRRMAGRPAGALAAALAAVSPGLIWLAQTYFAIRGLRNYGYNQLADEYTLQVFDRLSGLKEGAPIHENYGTHTGERLKAPHFSWSSSHLLMMYDDYGK